MSDATKNCPMCGEQILAVARKCRYCGEYLDPAARAQDLPDAVTRTLMPVGCPASAIAAGYLGLFAVLPFLGLVPGVLAVIFGIIALKKINRDPSLCGKGRAWFGIILGTLAPLFWIGAIVLAIMTEKHR